MIKVCSGAVKCLSALQRGIDHCDQIAKLSTNPAEQLTATRIGEFLRLCQPSPLTIASILQEYSWFKTKAKENDRATERQAAKRRMRDGNQLRIAEERITKAIFPNAAGESIYDRAVREFGAASSPTMLLGDDYIPPDKSEGLGLGELGHTPSLDETDGQQEE